MVAINFPTVRLASDSPPGGETWTDNDPLQSGDQITRNSIDFEWNGVAWIKVSTTFTTSSDGTEIVLATDTNVGIGVDDPTEKLDVDGTVKSTGLEVTGTGTLNGHNILTEDDIDPNNIDADTLDGIDSASFVQTTTDQSVGGIKTFTSNPIVSKSDPKVQFNDTDITDGSSAGNAEIDATDDNLTFKVDIANNGPSNSFIAFEIDGTERARLHHNGNFNIVGGNYQIGGTTLSLTNLGDVILSSPADTHVLKYDSGNTRWENAALVAGDIPNLNASKINDGTFTTARIPDLDTGKITTGVFIPARLATGGSNGQFLRRTAAGTEWATAGSGSTTFAALTDTPSGITASQFVKGNSAGNALVFDTLSASDIGSGTFNVARIPDLGAGKITSGTFTDALIPDLNASKITGGTFADGRIPSLAASKITSGEFHQDRLGGTGGSDNQILAIVSGTPDWIDAPQTGIEVQDETDAADTATKLVFEGAGVTATHGTGADDGTTTVTISGAGISNSDNVSEGSTNLYYTNERVDDRVDALLVDGTNLTKVYNDTANTLTLNVDTIALGTYTSGNYVATIAGTTNEIEITGSGSETAAVTIGLPNNVTISGNLTASGGTATFGTVMTTGNMSVAGNLTVNGTTVTVNSTTVSIDDPIFTLGGDTAPTTDDNKDRGIEFRYYDTDDSEAQIGFFGWDDSSDRFVALIDATNTSEVFSGTFMDAQFGTVYAALSGDVDGDVTGDVTGNADTATTLQTSRSIGLTGDVTGSVLFNGSSNVNISTSLSSNSVGTGELSAGSVTTSKLADDNVTFAKIEDIATSTFLGRNSTGSGDVEELSVDDAKTLLGITTAGITPYTHPSDGVDFGAATTGAEIISDVTVNSEGHVTGFTRRTLTYTDISTIAQRNTHVGEDAPDSPSSGDFWFDTDDATLYIYVADQDSSQWVRIGS